MLACGQNEVEPQEVCDCMSSYSIIGEKRESSEVYSECLSDLGIVLSINKPRDNEENRLIAIEMNKICPNEAGKFYGFLKNNK